MNPNLAPCRFQLSQSQTLFRIVNKGLCTVTRTGHFTAEGVTPDTGEPGDPPDNHRCQESPLIDPQRRVTIPDLRAVRILVMIRPNCLTCRRFNIVLRRTSAPFFGQFRTKGEVHVARLFVHPVCSNPVLGLLVHALRPNLDLEGGAVRPDHCCVKRLQPEWNMLLLFSYCCLSCPSNQTNRRSSNRGVQMELFSNVVIQTLTRIIRCRHTLRAMESVRGRACAVRKTPLSTPGNAETRSSAARCVHCPADGTFASYSVTGLQTYIPTTKREWHTIQCLASPPILRVNSHRKRK